MHRRNYEAIAQVLANHEPPEGGALSRWVWEGIVEELATVFEADNAQFDKERFIAACST